MALRDTAIYANLGGSATVEVVRRPATSLWARPIAFGMTVVTLAVALLFELPILVRVVHPYLGDDARFYRDLGVRWLTDGTFYLPHQLAGPHALTLQLDNLYPPTALAIFVPFTAIPAPFWWLIPLGLTGSIIWSWRPRWWVWPVIALLIAWPKTISSILWGNMDMWMVAGVAAGLRWGWPALLVTMKPSLVPFALVGYRHRTFWLSTLVPATLIPLMWPLWADYVTAMQNVSIPWDYSLVSIPTMFLPVAAWLGRARSAGRHINGSHGHG